MNSLAFLSKWLVRIFAAFGFVVFLAGLAFAIIMAIGDDGKPDPFVESLRRDSEPAVVIEK